MLFAGHKDATISNCIDGKEKVSKYTFHCGCNNLVTTSPYIYQHGEINFSSCILLRAFLANYQTSISPVFHFNFKLRGPPTAANMG